MHPSFQRYARSVLLSPTATAVVLKTAKVLLPAPAVIPGILRSEEYVWPALVAARAAQQWSLVELRRLPAQAAAPHSHNRL